MIEKDITIRGPGPDQLTLVQLIPIFPVIQVNSHDLDNDELINVNISGLKLKGGEWGINNADNLNLDNVLIEENSTGIINWGFGKLEITNSVIRGNISGGIENIGGSTSVVGDDNKGLIIRNSSITGNGYFGEGFGIVNAGGISSSLPYGARLEIHNSEISFNEDVGIYNTAPDEDSRDDPGRIFIYNSSIKSNGTGIRNYGQATIEDTEIQDGFLGIFNFGDTTILGSSLYDHVVGIKNEGTAEILNSTFSGNTNGIFANVNQSELNASFITVTDNTVGIYTAAVGKKSVKIRNSLVVNNHFQDCERPNDRSIIKASSSNMDTDGTCADASRGGFTTVTSAQLNLGRLKDNGGSTLTHSLNHGSVAINEVDVNQCTAFGGNPVNIDQRGFFRPAAGFACDLGSYEAGASEN